MSVDDRKHEVQTPQQEPEKQFPHHEDKLPEGVFDLLAKKKGSELNNEEKDRILEQIDMQTNDEGFYMDAFGDKVSYNGSRVLKKSFTKLPLTQSHLDEIRVCMNNFQYFRRNYCKIVTRSGINRPEPRDYQEKFEDVLLENELIASLQPRQSGKCATGDTKIKVRNKKTGLVEEIKMEEFHKRFKNNEIIR
jgi:hypothetical protein